MVEVEREVRRWAELFDEGVRLARSALWLRGIRRGREDVNHEAGLSTVCAQDHVVVLSRTELPGRGQWSDQCVLSTPTACT